MESHQAEPLTKESKTESKSKLSTTTSLIKDFCDYTACHGLGRTVGAKYLVQRIVWFLLFLSALAVAVFQLRELYMKYESRPVSTNIKITNKATLHFPQVTICNLNPINSSLIKKKDPELYKMIMKLSANKDGKIEDAFSARPKQSKTAKLNNASRDSDNEETEDKDPPMSRTRRSKIDEEDEKPISDKNDEEAEHNGDNMNDGDGDDDDDDEIPVDPTELLASHKHDQMMFEIVANINKNNGLEIGHQFKDSVLSCSYRGMDCRNKLQEHWQQFWHYKYGNCFMFNHGQTKSKKPLRSNKAGPTHGLTLTLFVDQANYMSQFTKKAGYKILINQQKSMIFPYEEGINVAPGVLSSIGIQKVLIKRVDPFKNNSCHDTNRTNTGNIYYENYRTHYSTTACRDSCLAYNQRKFCKCTEYKFPMPDNVPSCEIFNITQAKCLRKVTVLYKNNKLNCSKECTPACDEEYFKISTSYSAWPSKKYEEELIDKNPDIAMSKDIQFSDDYLKVRIFYEQLDYQVIEEFVSYGIVDFVSDVGGQLGLWLGVSVLAALEVIELFVLIFVYLCKKEKKQEKMENDNETEPLKDEIDLPNISNV